MFSRIMAPVDLAHVERLHKALTATADLSRLYDIPVTFVGVTAPAPSALAHTPEEYAERLKAFGAAQAASLGITADTLAITSHDPTTDVDDALLKAIDTTGADLVVMASHIPNLTDYVWPSNGGKMSGHARASVFVVRPD